MGLMKKTRVAGRFGLFALVLAIGIGAALPAVHAISREPVPRGEPMTPTVDRTKKGDRLRNVPAEDPAEKSGAKQLELRPRVTKLAGIVTMLTVEDAAETDARV